jgi:hypothetical protein
MKIFLSMCGGHAYNLSTQEAEAGRSQVTDQPGLHSKFQVIVGYLVRPCLKKPKRIGTYL